MDDLDCIELIRKAFRRHKGGKWWFIIVLTTQLHTCRWHVVHRPFSLLIPAVRSIIPMSIGNTVQY